MEMQDLLGLHSVWEVLWVVQAVAGGKRRRKRKSSHKGSFFFFFFPSLPCPVITHTYTEAFVNSHVGSEKQIEIRAARAGKRGDDKGKENSG